MRLELSPAQWFVGGEAACQEGLRFTKTGIRNTLGHSEGLSDPGLCTAASQMGVSTALCTGRLGALLGRVRQQSGEGPEVRS